MSPTITGQFSREYLSNDKAKGKYYTQRSHSGINFYATGSYAIRVPSTIQGLRKRKNLKSKQWSYIKFVLIVKGTGNIAWNVSVKRGATDHHPPCTRLNFGCVPSLPCVSIDT